MKLVDQWHDIESDLPEDWESVRLTLTFQHAGTVDVTAPVIAPGAPAPTTPGGTPSD